jgi:hypothetical protein
MEDKARELKTLIDLTTYEIIPIIEFLDKITYSQVFFNLKNSKLTKIMKNKKR